MRRPVHDPGYADAIHAAFTTTAERQRLDAIAELAAYANSYDPADLQHIDDPAETDPSTNDDTAPVLSDAPTDEEPDASLDMGSMGELSS